MGCVQTLVCVKQVKQDVPEEWDETMPLPGDIIEGIAEDEGDEFFMPAKGKSELSSQLGKINKQAENVWVKIRRGDSTLKLRARVVPDRASKLQKRYTITAATDDRHVVILGDCTLEQCTLLQGKINLPDPRSTVISSMLFMPLTGEHSVGSTTSRSMAWFSAAVTSGVPLVFVNIQTEQVVTSVPLSQLNLHFNILIHIFQNLEFMFFISVSKEKSNSVGRETSWGRQQSFNTTIKIVQGIRVWFLPGVVELLIVLTPEPGETRFGMDIKRTEEGFICVHTVGKGSAAERAGLKKLQEQAAETGHLVVISRLEGKSLMPSIVPSTGLIHCCDNVEVKNTLVTAIEKMDCINLHIMAWPNHKVPPQDIGAATLKPPNSSCTAAESFRHTNANHWYNQEIELN